MVIHKCMLSLISCFDERVSNSGAGNNRLVDDSLLTGHENTSKIALIVGSMVSTCHTKLCILFRG